LYAHYDGIDSNGDVFLEGGAVKISGPSRGTEGAIDSDGALIVTGGELITAGSVLNVSSESAQPTLLVSYTRQQASGSVITIKNASGDTILEYTSAVAYSASGFTSPDFVAGEVCALYIDGEKKLDIELMSGVTSIADDGGAYNGGMGGERGNRGGGTPQGGAAQGGAAPPDGGEMPFDGRTPPDNGEMPFGGRTPPDGERPTGNRTPPNGEMPYGGRGERGDPASDQN
jgi:hypothetical protein